MSQFFVYILANKHNTVLYTGVTRDLRRRMYEHKTRIGSAFTRRYNITKLVYDEVLADAYPAIAREKQIKAGPRKRKLALIEAAHPEWRDLADDL